MPLQEPIDPLYELLEQANPNPDRVGCLTDEQILGFAEGRRAVTDPGFAHLTACFPCYRQFGKFCAEMKRTTHRRRVAAAAIVALLAGLGVLFWFWQHHDTSTAPLVATGEAPRPGSAIQAKAALIDLRPFAVVRSETPKEANRSVVLDRGRISATIYLPIGSEPGRYEIQILTEDLASLRTASENALFKDGITSVTAELDLQSLIPGKYRLALRLSGQDWRWYPVEIR
jgi:hypothetical protein